MAAVQGAARRSWLPDPKGAARKGWLATVITTTGDLAPPPRRRRRPAATAAGAPRWRRLTPCIGKARSTRFFFLTSFAQSPTTLRPHAHVCYTNTTASSKSNDYGDDERLFTHLYGISSTEAIRTLRCGGEPQAKRPRSTIDQRLLSQPLDPLCALSQRGMIPTLGPGHPLFPVNTEPHLLVGKSKM